MHSYIKKARIFSIILIGIELIALILMILMFFIDGFLPEAKNFILENHIFFIVIGLFLIVDWAYFLFTFAHIKKIRYKNNLKTANLFSETIQESLNFSKLGIVVVDDLQDVIWTNEVINQTDNSLLDKNLLDVLPKLRELQENTQEDMTVRLKLKDVVFDVTYVKSCNVYFFNNVNDYFNMYNYSIESALVLGIVKIDNYDELAKNQEETSDTISKIVTKINEYFSSYSTILRKYSNNSYFAICNYKSLVAMKADEFSILDTIKELANSEEVVPTLSIGFAHDFPSIPKLNEIVKETIDIAIARGGDQVVISKFAADLEFFGGRSEGIEKRNKVKVRIVADSIFSILKGAKNVLVMGHTDMDMDALGSCLGIKAIVDSLNPNNPIPCQIVYDSKLVERKARNAMSSSFSKEEVKAITISPKDALSKIGSKTILVCVDFHRPSLALSKEVLEKCDKTIVIDHHRRSEECIENTLYTYFEITASSASEQITELVYYSSINPPVVIPPSYSTIMLSGIFLDTNYYRSTTSGFRTFEASMLLRSFGADNVAADEFLKDEFEEHQLISKIVSTIQTPYRGIVYCANQDKNFITESVVLSKVAQQCINMKGISAAFAIGKIGDNEVKISARSDGHINVQLLCEKLGGGGHFTMAAAVIKSKTVDTVIQKLEDILRIYLDDARNNEGEE